MRKKKFIFAALFALLIGAFCVNSKAFANETLPRISFVGVEHSPLLVGESETFYITSVGAEKVEYRIWIKKDKDKEWKDLLGKYAGPYDANTPVFVKPPETFEKGKYKVSIWVRRAGKSGAVINKDGNYDSFYTVNLNCVERGTRLIADGDLDMEKSTYKVGEKVVINGIKDLRGKEGPFLYKLHLFNNSKIGVKDDMWNGKGWALDVTEYGEKIEWTPKEPGIYVLDVWGKPQNSKLKYEVWKLKVIKVVEGETSGQGTEGGNTGVFPGGEGGNTVSSEILSMSLRMSDGEVIAPVKDGNLYTFDLTGKDNYLRFIGLNVEVSEACKMNAYNTIDLNKGMNYKTVLDLYGEDSGDPGVSILKLKSLKEENGIDSINISLEGNSTNYKLKFLLD